MTNSQTIEVGNKVTRKSNSTIRFHTIKDWNQPKNGIFQIMIDCWWFVDGEGNPLFYSERNYPQCNRNRSILEHQRTGYQIKKLSIVYVPVRVQDYIER